MDISVSDIVLSTAGRDKGGIFYVLEAAGEGYVYISDGRRRRIEKPKKKKIKHLKRLSRPGEGVALQRRSNAEIRRILQEFAAGEGTGGG